MQWIVPSFRTHPGCSWLPRRWVKLDRAAAGLRMTLRRSPHSPPLLPLPSTGLRYGCCCCGCTLGPDACAQGAAADNARLSLCTSDGEESKRPDGSCRGLPCCEPSGVADRLPPAAGSAWDGCCGSAAALAFTPAARCGACWPSTAPDPSLPPRSGCSSDCNNDPCAGLERELRPCRT